ncbi:MAG: hypothetical protein M3069_01605 [Chloroflexota bacterium]|nr:hypothetical protein [Chloroflexota bacterium]
MWFFGRVPNPLDRHTQGTPRLQPRVDPDSRWRLLVFVGGGIVLCAFGILVLMGLPGTGLVLVPIGVGMILFSAIDHLVNSLGS